MIIERRETRKVYIGGVAIGGDTPISIQSMTCTLTTDIQATIRQVNECAELGVDIMRISVPDKESSEALAQIIPHCDVPIVADIHYHYRRGIESAIAGAKCLRINPGNIGSEEKVKEVIKAAKDYGCAIRIGVNAGSLENDLLEKYREPCPEAMVESAKRHIAILEDNDFFQTKVSMKASSVMMTVKAYRLLTNQCDYPFHIGITEAGGLMGGTVKSSIGLGALLMEGIGDTMRVSLSADPKEEVKVGNLILKSLGLRHRGVNIISCPTCARKGIDVISIVNELEQRLEHVKTPITLSIIGCAVNGIGEAMHSDIGVVGAKGDCSLYIDGEYNRKIKVDELIENIINLCNLI